MKENKNIILYYAYNFLFLAMLTDPIIIYYYKTFDIQNHEIFLLSALSSFTILIFEIPSGAISDYIGHKYSVLIGSLFLSFSILFKLLVPSLMGFSISAVMGGISLAFISGSSSAYLHCALDKLDRKDDFGMISAKIHSYNLFIVGFTSLFIGFLFSYNRYLPLIISLVATFFSASIFLFSDNFKSSNKNHGRGYKALFNIIHDGLGIFRKSKQLRFVLILSIGVGISLNGLVGTMQMHLIHQEIPSEYFGIIYTVLYLISSGTSYFFSLRKNKFPENKLLLLIPILLIITSLSLFSGMKILIVMTILPRIIIGFYPIVTREIVNRNITNISRATVMSIRSFTMRLSFIIVNPVLAFIISKSNLQYGMLVYAFFAFATLFLIIFRPLENEEIKGVINNGK